MQISHAITKGPHAGQDDGVGPLQLGGVDPARIAKDIPFAGVLLKKDKDITAMQRRMR